MDRRFFRKEEVRPVKGKISVYLVRGYLVIALYSVFFRSVQKHPGSHNIGLNKNAGVREYWIVDPRRRIVTVNDFENNRLSVQYSFDTTIKVNIYDDLLIDFSEISELLNTTLS